MGKGNVLQTVAYVEPPKSFQSRRRLNKQFASLTTGFVLLDEEKESLTKQHLATSIPRISQPPRPSRISRQILHQSSLV